VDVKDLYRGLPLRIRLHTRLRTWTCPLRAVAQHLPREGRLLEVGCGHGVFSNLAALSRPDLDVLGIDPAAEKVSWAQASVRGRGNIRFEHGALDGLGEEGFEAIAVIDVLYLVSRGCWADFLDGCRRRLAPGGRLLLKEVDVRPRWKFLRCVLQETLSVRLLGITLGRDFAFAGRREMVEVLRQAGFGEVTVRDLGRDYLTPHVLYETVRA
jgi:cyclopropane fatty-acyl-phospholipid synthase-like methyltransferase